MQSLLVVALTQVLAQFTFTARGPVLRVEAASLRWHSRTLAAMESIIPICTVKNVLKCAFDQLVLSVCYQFAYQSLEW